MLNWSYFRNGLEFLLKVDYSQDYYHVNNKEVRKKEEREGVNK